MSKAKPKKTDNEQEDGPPGAGAPEGEDIDLSEKGGKRGGEQQVLDRRLFMQFVAFTGCPDYKTLFLVLGRIGIDCVLYKDLNDPRGIGLLALSEDPADFGDRLRDVLVNRPFQVLPVKHEYTMLGRTYALGYEPDLEQALIERPKQTVMNMAWPWAIWYPLRRTGEFARLDEKDQRRILKEHGGIGLSFGRADLAHDVRLKCYGLDKNDNDFVIGLIGKELHALSAVVERMRKTEQTSQYIEKLGPFFVGRAVFQGQPVDATGSQTHS